MRFLQAVDDAIASITQDPVEWPILEDGVRRYLLDKFPYGILYTLDSNELRILSFAHLKRHPDYWKDRL
jgi:toxin ParE1/3/4